MKIVAGIQCYNEEDFIRETISSLYLFCDTIVITEGCWKSGKKMTKSKRSTDKTIEFIKFFPDPENKIKLHFFNGKTQEDHRQFTLEKAKKYKPDWYLNGDGDEIFHENEIEFLFKAFKSGARAINPMHKLFWNGLKYYEDWKPAGRFFNLSGLNLNKVMASRECCNSIDYTDEDIFQSSLIPSSVYIYHPSYSKRIARQKFKIEHRTIDNNKKFPHRIHDQIMLRGNMDLKTWLKSLKKIDKCDLPRCLQEHKFINDDGLFEKFISSSIQD